MYMFADGIYEREWDTQTCMYTFADRIYDRIRATSLRQDLFGLVGPVKWKGMST